MRLWQLGYEIVFPNFYALYRSRVVSMKLILIDGNFFRCMSETECSAKTALLIINNS